MSGASSGGPAPLIGVLGGMGPLATLDFLHKLLAATPARRDQEHVPTVVWNVPQIPDRQHALAGKGVSPLPAMIDGIRRLNAAGATRIVIPCNTAHLWFDALAAASAAPIIHIADATLAAFGKLANGANVVNPAPSGVSAVPAAETGSSAAPAQPAAGGGPVGIIATQGALEAELYQRRFAAHGIASLCNSAYELDTLFVPGCYAVKQNELDRAAPLIEACGRALIARGAQQLVLACTEVPVALAHARSSLLACSIDPTQALAEACLAYWQAAGAAVD